MFFNLVRSLFWSSLVLLALPACLLANQLDFTVSEKGDGIPTVLIIGGIQGDEPGGFSAAAIVATQYDILHGSVIVVPNLNFPSIITRSRGENGDMNRKFAYLNPTDPDYDTVRRIQDIIVSPEIDMVLNLHDGSGYYRPEHHSNLYNPQRWGQSVIIDQEDWPGIEFGNLLEIADYVADHANGLLLDPDHVFHVKDTKTAAEDPEMAKSLTWFALNNDKSAFGLEVSKEFGTAQRAYYHLCMIEAFLDQAGVLYQRNFELTPHDVGEVLSNDIYVGLIDNRVVLPLTEARREQAGTLPLPANREYTVSSTMPIVAVTHSNNKVDIHYGNNTVASFKPEWMETCDELDSVMVQVDDDWHLVRFGDTIHVEDNFLVSTPDGFRANIIGVPIGRDESDIVITRQDFRENYSVDVGGNTYRVEVYKDNLYCGTFLVSFGSTLMTVTSPLNPILPSLDGVESEFGR